MEAYKDKSGKSGVAAFEIGENFIIVKFVEGEVYLYDEDKPGKPYVDQMKLLAQAGKGLSTYISRVVRKNFAKKLS